MSVHRFLLLPAWYLSAVETIPDGDAKYFKVTHFSQQMTFGIISVLHVTANGRLGPLR